MRTLTTNQISILTYHSLDLNRSVLSVDPRDFAEQMTCLADKGFRGISLREALEYREVNLGWPTNTAVLTFDDGFANFYEEAFPVLQRFNFSATLFVVTGHMGGHNNWDGGPPGMGTQRLVSWEQTVELDKAGIEIGSHTRTHCDLRRCSAQEIKNEISSSCADIENHLGHEVQSFAYPYGGVNHLVQQLAARDFRAACTTELRRANGDPLNLLPRVDMYYVKSLRRFANLLDGQLDQYLTVRRCGRLARRILAPAPA
ncbi:MAG TPA: polysaccharide deacetylase family protein [Pyrinomonadaceae bacterium]